MQKFQVQGIHHLTMVGADCQTSIDFWEGVLGMPFIFEQPNLDVTAHLICLVGTPRADLIQGRAARRRAH